MQNPLDIASVSRCKKCPSLGKDHVPSEGNLKADVMFIGQSPGVTEVQLGRPFVGPAGDLLDFALDQAELERGEVYIANVLKCHPPGNRPGLPGEKAACYRAWLHGEITVVDPRLVVLVGKEAHTTVLPSHIPFEHLHVCRNTKQNRLYLSVYHPAYFLRLGRMEEFVLAGNKIKECIAEVEGWETSKT